MEKERVHFNVKQALNLLLTSFWVCLRLLKTAFVTFVIRMSNVKQFDVKIILAFVI